MYVMIASYIAGILISDKVASLSIMISVITIYTILLLNLPKYKLSLAAGCLLFVLGCIYPQLLLQNTRKMQYIHGSTIFTDAVVLKTDATNIIIKTSEKRYVIYNMKSFEPGDEIKITARYMEFEKASNPYVFDIKKYYERKGISASLIPEDIIKTGVSGRIDLQVIRAAYKVRKVITKRLARYHEGQELGFIQGMLTGHTQQLDEMVKENFRKAGLSHIMAVSGAHVAFVLLPFRFVIFRTIKRKRTRIMLLTIPAVSYMFITGLGASVIRAVFMLLLLFFLDWHDIKIASVKIIAACALIMLLISPFYIYDVSFLMSFSAAAGIILMHKRILNADILKKTPGFIKQSIAISTAAMLAILPVTISYFNKISLISIFTNIIFIPFTGILTPLSLFSLLPWAGDIISPVLNRAASVFLSGVSFFADFKFSQLTFPAIGYCSVISYYFILVLLFIVKKKDINIINYALFVLIVSLLLYNNPKSTQINFLAAGNGDSILITTENTRILVDGGDHRNSFAKYQLLPYLIKRGVMTIDIVFVTHSHADHMSGIFDVLKELKVKSIMIPDTADDSSYQPLIEAALLKGTAVYRVSENDSIRIGDDIQINILNPEHGIIYHNVNNGSIVLGMKINGFNVLLTGDAEKETEQRLVTKLYRHDLLKAGHHGSLTSSTQVFIQAARPRISVISTGKNAYGHPSPAVTKRLSLYGELFITKYDGHLKFTFKDDIIYLDKFIR